MALNANHAFEDLGESKCAIVEKNCTPARAEFIRELLELNGYSVVIAKSPPPKAAAKPTPKPPAEGEVPPVVEAPPPPPPPPDTYTVGVTDLTFNPVNVIYNRNLKTHEGHIVTPAYWKQQEEKPREEEWYWSR
jgi:hypothetical protein